MGSQLLPLAHPVARGDGTAVCRSANYPQPVATSSSLGNGLCPLASAYMAKASEPIGFSLDGYA
eukprot:4553909-Alexandrium_andersonii.AAC.1